VLCLTLTYSTIYAHKNTVLCCGWSINGTWLATGSRDQLVKVFDLRKMAEIHTYRGHAKEVRCTRNMGQSEFIKALKNRSDMRDIRRSL